jgi:allantoinase
VKGQAILSSNPRIPYRLAGDARRLPPFRGKSILVQLIVNMEHWRFDHPMPRGISTPPQGRFSVPDVPNFAWHEYGMRVGMQRLFDALGEGDLPVGATLNANVVDVFQPCAETALRLGWEFIGHGLYQQAVHTEPNEFAIIRQALDKLQKFAGTKIRGWLGPGLGESSMTPEYLRQYGIEYLLDWVVDDQPCWMTTAEGPLLSVPYSLELNDSTIYAIEKHATGEFANRVRRSLDALERETSSGPKVMTVALHPHLVGVPHRITELRQIIEMIRSHPMTTFVTPGEVADWFVELQPAQTTAASLNLAV